MLAAPSLTKLTTVPKSDPVVIQLENLGIV
jgi:hypothetical protein